MKNLLNFQKDIQHQAVTFLEKIFNELESVQIDLRDWPIDHLCYRTSSENNYQKIKNCFQHIGELLVESEVNGRLIATYKLKEPILFKQHRIELIEVPAPKRGKTTIEGFEHIEAVIDISFLELEKLFPHITFNKKAITKEINPDIEVEFGGCAIKFHHQSLEEVIEYEKRVLNK